MKPSLMFSLLIFSMFLFEGQGILHRKHMTKLISATSTTANDKNVPKADKKFTHEVVAKEGIFPTTLMHGNSKHGKTEVVYERYPDVIDITGMDNSPAKRKPPIHN